MRSTHPQKINTHTPQPREVWLIDANAVNLNAPSKDLKFARPVIIVTNHKLAKPRANVINIVPTTTKNEPGLLNFPIYRGYEECYYNFKPDPKSTALLQFYRPIKRSFFIKRCGLLNIETYEAIQYSLCTEVIGYYGDYDLSEE